MRTPTIILALITLLAIGIIAAIGFVADSQKPKPEFEIAIPSEEWRNLPINQWPAEAQSLYWEMEARK